MPTSAILAVPSLVGGEGEAQCHSKEAGGHATLAARVGNLGGAVPAMQARASWGFTGWQVLQAGSQSRCPGNPEPHLASRTFGDLMSR